MGVYSPKGICHLDTFSFLIIMQKVCVILSEEYYTGAGVDQVLSPQPSADRYFVQVMSFTTIKRLFKKGHDLKTLT